ncbi:MoxR family ATPase [Phenylobacterium sp.]|uniref:AAA family ATPase n=1 Tax=Phenylobacterium sp. TaxID=1871053 RepID=UPI0027301769|nr:MoxR family ATPase [Phenylobacterium sp.]MDP2214446.1 MoxR family ATPase [Phenylobacterium sp.]
MSLPEPATSSDLPGPAWAERLSAEIGKAVLGQNDVVERLQIALLVGGHVLLEGMPGLAKTLLVKSLGQAMGLDFERIQFTPDLLPSDVVGTLVYSPHDGSFTPHLGPVFANIVLADEINRSPAKVQSALLEAMQERQVTIGGTRHPLPNPFLVLATQNPVEHEGTYPLPEAQTDRFLFKLLLDYPSGEDELEMLRRWGSTTRSPVVEAASNGPELLALREGVDGVFVAPEIQAYLLALVRQTRDMAAPAATALRPLAFGASPRATLALYQSSRALAFIRGLEQVTPSLVQEVAADVLRHRIGLTYEAEAAGLSAEAVIAQVLAAVPVPG